MSSGTCGRVAVVRMLTKPKEVDGGSRPQFLIRPMLIVEHEGMLMSGYVHFNPTDVNEKGEPYGNIVHFSLKQSAIPEGENFPSQGFISVL